MGHHVSDILEQYLYWEKLKAEKEYHSLAWEEKDELRLENDRDAMYYHETVGLKEEQALYADTIISFWTLYKRLLELEAGWCAYRTIKSLSRLIFQMNKVRQNDYTEKIRKVNEKMEPFAEICYTKGNYMLLPDRKMNPFRYQVTEDRIDLTLYECFGGGAFAPFFQDEQHLKKWIDEQQLSSLFINGEICRNKIKWFVDEKHKLISEMNTTEICKYLENAILLIQERNQSI